MSEVTHTPLPWKMVSDPNFDNGLVYTSVQPVNVDEEAMKPLAMMNGEYHVCRMSHTAAEWRFSYHRANAEFIVTACNSYYDNQARISALEAENADLRSGEYLARVVEERDRMRKAAEHGLSFAESWVDEHGGINGCEMQDRVSLEFIRNTVTNGGGND